MQRLSIMALLLTTSAHAADFPVSNEDQRNIAAICTIAAKSPLTTDQQTAQIASWCVMWGNRMQAAEKAKLSETKPADADKKDEKKD